MLEVVGWWKPLVKNRWDRWSTPFIITTDTQNIVKNVNEYYSGMTRFRNTGEEKVQGVLKMIITTCVPYRRQLHFLALRSFWKIFIKKNHSNLISVSFKTRQSVHCLRTLGSVTPDSLWKNDQWSDWNFANYFFFSFNCGNIRT